MSSPSPVVVEALGVPLGIDVAALDAPRRAAVRAAWSGARAPRGNPARAIVTPTASLDPGAMLAALSSAVTTRAIEERRGELWMLHAAGVAGADGGVVVLVGASGAGKTTAIRVLASAAGYVSDEAVGVAVTGEVQPYRKPLSLITAGVAHKVQRSPDELGLGPLPGGGLRLARIVLLDRRTGGGAARLVPVPVSEAIAALAAQSSGLVRLPRPVATMAELIERTGGVLRAEYTEARELAALVREMLAAEAPPLTTAGIEAAPPPEITRAGAAAPVYDRADAVDAHRLSDDTVAVLTANPDGSGMLRILAGVGPTLWDAARGATHDDLVAAVDARFDCPDPRSVTDAAVASLVDAGLLRITGA